MLTIEAEPSVEASSIARSSATLENCDIDENVSPAPKMEDFYGEPIAESKLAKKRQGGIGILGISHVYKVTGRGAAAKIRLVTRDANGYRYHPSTIKDLAEYQQRCMNLASAPPELVIRLVARLLQDSYAVLSLSNYSFCEDISSDIWRILNNKWIGHAVISKKDIDFIVATIGRRVNYGPPIPKCREFLLQNYNLFAEENICVEIASVTLESEPARVDMTPPQPEIKCKVEKLEKYGESKKPVVAPPAKPNSKISSFFTVFKKTVASTPTNDYFQPFSPKPSQFLAPYNPLAEFYRDPIYWDHQNPVKVPGTMKRKRCRCGGFGSKPTFLIMKLLQFHSNHRPAYFGTWRSTNSAIRPRNPFAQASDLDYDYDSDEDWGEDAEILDAESISGTDEEDEEISEMGDEYDAESNVSRLLLANHFRIG